MFKEIKIKQIVDTDPDIIAWQKQGSYQETGLIMYIFPQPGDNIKSKKLFVVKDYEKALFYNKGQLLGILGGGIYELDKKAKMKGTEIVWIDTSFIDIQWGIPQSSGIPTLDGIIIGLHGDLKLKIRDVSLFYNDVVAGKGPWTRQQLKEFINGLLFTSLRDIFKKYTAKQVMLEERDRIINLITGKVVEEFLRYGLELETLDILGVKTPGGNETLFNVEKVKFKLSEDAEIYKLNLELANSGKRIAELKEKLDTLDELLVNDKISKELYKTRVQRIEKELKELEQRSK